MAQTPFLHRLRTLRQIAGPAGGHDAQGATLGNRASIGQAGQVGRQVQRDGADRFAANLLPVIRSIQSTGPIGMAAIAKLLNERESGQHAAGNGMCRPANLLARANNCAAG